MEIDIKLLKKKGMRIFFALEVVFFIAFYLFGSEGIQRMMVMQQQERELDAKLNEVGIHVAHLSERLEQWNTTPFHTEKIAREQLQMAREGEEIYYL